MKFAILALAALTVAQDWPPFYDVQSQGFRLQLLSTNQTLQGIVLGACHKGAAHEGLCTTKETLTNASRSYTTFYHNVSSSHNALANAADTPGVLGWTLTAGTSTGTINISSAMEFQYRPETNLADIVFGPGYNRYTEVFFEAGSERMYIGTSYNDLVSPPVYYETQQKPLNWYVCLTRYTYLVETLAWKVGSTGEPQNPSCQAVGVRRVWV